MKKEVKSAYLGEGGDRLNVTFGSGGKYSDSWVIVTRVREEVAAVVGGGLKDCTVLLEDDVAPYRVSGVVNKGMGQE